MPARTDANPLALKVARILLNAAEDLSLTVEGVLYDVKVERLGVPDSPWDSTELYPDTEGPWPRPLVVTCTPKNGTGSRVLSVKATPSRDKDKYKGNVALKVRLINPAQTLLFINLKLPLQEAVEGTPCPILASTSIVKRRGAVPEDFHSQLRAAVDRSGLSATPASRLELCRVSIPGLELAPSPLETFRRVLHISLLKLPFLVNILEPGEAGMEEALDEPDEEERPDVDALMEEAISLEDPEPLHWDAERLDLTVPRVQPFLGDLELPPRVLEQACAALSSGKHLLLVGPPGTGKTELAHALARAARSEGYCRGAFEATASADWTTYETIGGYALGRDQGLHFREGAFLRAVSTQQWLLVDELNRADVDKAFGELMTVLSGKGTDTPFELEDQRHVSIGFEAWRTHRVSRTFRVLATMNTWDKTSLFRLSYAVQRRFAILHVGIPTDEAFARLISRAAFAPGAEAALDDDTVRRLTRLFQRQGLLGVRDIGPAIPLDIVRYLRRRAAGGLALAEAIALFLLPQLEGLDTASAREVYSRLELALSEGAPEEALRELRARCEELWPPGSLP